MEQGLFYVVAALGKVQVNDHDVMVISPESPLLAALVPMNLGELREFKGTSYRLVDIA